MKKLFSAALALIMLFSLAACGKTKDHEANAKPTEPAASEASEPSKATDAPATQAPDDTPVYLTGGVDYCEELKLGNTYYYDLDGDELGDTVEYRNDIKASPFFGSPYLRVTFGAYPDYPAIWIAPEFCTIWVIDSDPEDGSLEILETDDGDSDDPASCLLVTSRNGNGFTEVSGPGVRIDAEHPFSSRDGFPIVTWTQLMGTSMISGKMRTAYHWDTGWVFERVGDAYYYNDYYSVVKYTLKNPLDVYAINEDGTVGDKLTLAPGETVSPYSTDNESFIVLRLADGSLVRTGVEKRGWSESSNILFPWTIGGVWQDMLMDLHYSG